MKTPPAILSAVATTCATALFLQDHPVAGSLVFAFGVFVWISDFGQNVAASKKPTPPPYAQ